MDDIFPQKASLLPFSLQLCVKLDFMYFKNNLCCSLKGASLLITDMLIAIGTTVDS